MDIDQELIELLAQVGLMAGAYCMAEEAEAITAVLENARPDSERPHIIRALTLINTRDPSGAARILRDKALKLNPSSSTAKTFLGMALHMEGRSSERDRVLTEVISANDDESAVTVARDLMKKQ